MIYYASAFVIVALFAAVLGFSGIAGAVGLIGKILLYIFTATLVLSLIADCKKRTHW